MFIEDEYGDILTKQSQLCRTWKYNLESLLHMEIGNVLVPCYESVSRATRCNGNSKRS